MATLKQVSPKLAHFYAATSHVLDANPDIAKVMNIVMRYEIEAPVGEIAVKHRVDGVINASKATTGINYIEVANRYGPDAQVDLPVIQIN